MNVRRIGRAFVVSAAAAALTGGLTVPALAGQASQPPRAGGWSMVTGAATNSCGIRLDGGLWCWGDNQFGQLGIGSAGGVRLIPTRVGVESDWAYVTGNNDSMCGIRTQGTLWCWGANFEGQLGDGTHTDRPAPQQVGTDTDWADVAVGTYHACAVKTTGSLWCWGSNTQGELGDGTTQDHLTPQQVGSDLNWATVTSGTYFSCGTRTDGTLWCWGDGSVGQLGNGSAADRRTPTQAGSDSDWSAVTAGFAHACGVRTDGSLWCWGNNKWGQLGVGEDVFISLVPLQVARGTTWNSVAVRRNHTCGLQTNGTIWCWAANAGGSPPQRVFTPHQLGSADSWAQLGAGNVHDCAIQANGVAWCWGKNDVGQLGDGTTDPSSLPVRVRRA